MYNIDDLERKFKKDTNAVEKEREEMVERFKRDYPNEEIPPYLTDDFNFAKAMWTLCSEIINLREILLKK